MKLYSYFRSSAAYRVRIALNLKNLPYDYAPVHLLRDGGEQLKPAYRSLNPDAILPTLVDGDNVLQQSLAIIEYLEETHPEPPLLPKSPADRAYVRSVALQVACEIHPLNNLRVLKYLKHTVGADDATKDEWYRHWVEVWLCDAGGASGGRFAYRQAVLRRHADLGRRMSRAAGVQRAALQDRRDAVSDDPAYSRSRVAA